MIELSSGEAHAVQLVLDLINRLFTPGHYPDRVKEAVEALKGAGDE